MNRRERINDPNDALLLALKGFQTSLWTALPAVVDSFDPVSMSCSLRPTIQASQLLPSGAEQWINLPLLIYVPVVFMGGGGFTLTYPVAPGDEALVVFSSRCIDEWWQSGKSLNVQAERRMHDLSDGFALIGPRSKPRALPAVSTGSAQLRSDDGSLYLELAGGQVMNIAAPGGLNIVGDVTVTGTVFATGEITALGTHTMSAHTHSGVQPGGSNTGPPSG